jgi:hypothetical protein
MHGLTASLSKPAAAAKALILEGGTCRRRPASLACCGDIDDSYASNMKNMNLEAH